MAKPKPKPKTNIKQSTKTNGKNDELQKRNRMIGILLVLLLLLLLWWGAAHFNWWPFNGDGDGKTPTTSGQESSGSDGGGATGTGGGTGSGTGATGASGAPGSSGSSGSNGSNGSNGGTTTTTPTPAPSPIINFSVGISNGDTKAAVEAKSNGISQTCTVTANTVAAGKTEVCTYSDGSKVVTVTYLNDQVVNVSRSGL